jgi:hypothetical protein
VALRVRDRERALFGAESHKHGLLPRLDEAEVDAVEAAIGVSLPAAYRRYVTEVSSGGMGPGYGLPWLPALLYPPERERFPYEAAADRIFPDDEARAWARREFAPLTEVEIQARLARLPPEDAQRAIAAASFVRTYEGRRDHYLDHCRDLFQTAPRGRAHLPFRFTARHTAAPDIDAIDWSSLDNEAWAREWSRLKRHHGFDDAEDGTLRLSDYGCGVIALLVLTGPQRGVVWAYDTENLVLEPFFPGWAEWHDYPAPEPPWDFDAWIRHWMSGAERQLDAGLRPAGRLLWG